MANLKEAMKAAKQTGKPQKVTEPVKIESVKVNTSIRLDLDVITWFKTEAAATGIPYQTLMQSVLFQHTKKGSIIERIERLENVKKTKAG